MPWTLSIDFGTTNTAAAYALDGQPPRPVRLSNNADTIPSAVLAGPGGIVVGTEAVRSRRLRPECYLESPKLAIGQDAVLLGDDEVPVPELVGSVLRHVTRTAARFAGSDTPTRVVLTHPHDWAAGRRAALRAAWEATGVAVEEVRLVPEPIAAATWLAMESEISVGATIGVFDYGGGTCDVAVLRRTESAEEPWEVLGHGGTADLGGATLDLILMRWVRESLLGLGHADVNAALERDLGALRTLQDEVRLAKEALSQWPDSEIPVAVGPHSLSVSITAPEFGELIADEVERARDLTERVLQQAGVTPNQLTALYLTGGSSHLLAVHAVLEELLGGRPATLGDPKMVVALGAHSAPTAGLGVAVRQNRTPPPSDVSRTEPPDTRRARTGGAELAARVFTRPVAAGPEHEKVIRMLEEFRFFDEPADKALGLKWKRRKGLIPEEGRPALAPGELWAGRVSGWADIERLRRVHSSANPGLIARLDVRGQHTIDIWGFDGSTTIPAYVVLLPRPWLLEAWSGSPAISPLVLTRDVVTSVRPKRNARWLLREYDQAVNGGTDTALELTLHTGTRYAVQHTMRLELLLDKREAARVRNILG